MKRTGDEGTKRADTTSIYTPGGPGNDGDRRAKTNGNGNNARGNIPKNVASRKLLPHGTKGSDSRCEC